MRKDYFIALDTEVKTELTWNYGEIIATVETKDTFISLFLLDNFFIELLVDKINNELIDINIQDDDDVLYEYVSHIDLVEILT